MTAKEKASELYDKMEVDVNNYNSIHPTYSEKQAKECCVVAIDEIISELNQYDRTDGYTVYRIDFWTDVKAEILSY